MPIWDKLKQELDRAGKVAASAVDEGRVRLDAFRVRQLADKAAQTLGYAVYRARTDGGDLDAESYRRLAATLQAHEAEAARLERQLEEISGRKGGGGSGTSGETPPVNPS
jgi:hypothetical protein